MYGVFLMGLQETCMTQLDLFKIRSMWGNVNFDFSFSSAHGKSGGPFSIWDPNGFSKTSVVCTPYLIILDGVWIAYNLECFMVNVYAPLDMVGKQQWWDRLSLFFRKHRGNFIIFGDFNIVRSANERFGSVFSNTYVENFNEFTDDIGAVDVPIG